MCFEREAWRAHVKRQMRTERRWARGRNTRGLPVGMGVLDRKGTPFYSELTERLNRQATFRRDRLPKFARRVLRLAAA